MELSATCFLSGNQACKQQKFGPWGAFTMQAACRIGFMRFAYANLLGKRIGPLGAALVLAPRARPAFDHNTIVPVIAAENSAEVGSHAADKK